MKHFVWLGLAAVAVSASVNAQNVVAVSMTGQPLIYTNAGRPTGCGLRIVGVVDLVGDQRDFRTFDVSLNLHSTGIAMGKVIGELQSAANPDSLVGRRQVLFGAWFRAEGGEPVSPVGKSFAVSSSDKGAYLFQATMSASADFLLASIKGQSILVAIGWKRGTEAIYSGTVALTNDERRQVAACVSQVFK